MICRRGFRPSVNCREKNPGNSYCHGDGARGPGKATPKLTLAPPEADQGARSPAALPRKLLIVPAVSQESRLAASRQPAS